MQGRAPRLLTTLALSTAPRAHLQLIGTPLEGNTSFGNISVGALLAEIYSRQQAKLPAAEQLSLDKATLDAMTRSASDELASEWDILTDELSAVEQNVSTALQRELGDAEARALQRIMRTERNLRRNVVLPNRREIRRELLSLRDQQAARARWRGDVRPARLRDEWWDAKVRDSDAGQIRAAEWSASGLGLLLGMAALNSLLHGAFVPTGEVGSALIVGWRCAFTVAVLVYTWSIVGIFLVEATSTTRGDVERRNATAGIL